ncbi:hypothetical protein Gotur_034877, partial [Gossypium turneri]
MHRLRAYELVPEPERSHTHSSDSSYHPELSTLPASYPLHYSTPIRSYSPQYSIPPGSSPSGHMIFLPCFAHTNLRLKRMLIVAITPNVNV